MLAYGQRQDHSRQPRSDWSGFGRTNFLRIKIICMLAPAVSVVATINYHNCYQNIKKTLLLRDESTNKLVS